MIGNITLWQTVLYAVRVLYAMSYFIHILTRALSPQFSEAYDVK